MKQKKQPKSKKTSSGKIHILFLVLSVMLFLLSVVGFACGVIIVGVFCLLFGALCFYEYRIMKNDAAAPVREAAVLETIRETVNDVKLAEVKDDAADHAATVNAAADTVEIVYPDGHTERRMTWMKIDRDDACLITNGGKTYHRSVGCYKNWASGYREAFGKWHLITVEDAKERGLRRCRFCYAYELAKEDSRAVVHTLSCAAQKYQDQIHCCKVGETCSAEYDVEKDRYAVLDSSGLEIGYLPMSAAEKHDADLEDCEIFIDEITETASGKYKIKLIIR